MSSRFLVILALLALPVFAAPVLGQDEQQKQKTGRETTTEQPQIDALPDTAMLGRQGEGIPTPNVNPNEAKSPDASPTVTTPRGDESVRGGAQPTEPSAEPQVTEPSGAGEPQVTEPSGAGESQVTEPSGANEPQVTEPSGAGEPQVTQPSDTGEPQPGAAPSAEPERGGAEPGVSAAATGTPTLTAKLVDPSVKAKEQAATIQTTVSGIEIVDPATTGEKAKAGQGHLHYRIDKGPIVATTAEKLSFHDLSPGQHTVTVVLASNDHKPIGKEQKLTITIPSPGAGGY